MARLLILCLTCLSFSLQAQKNVRAWYAEGQVWIVWNIQLPIAETVGIYSDDDPFTTINDATLIGRPFHLDYLPVALKEQVDTSLTYRIPDGQGGTYQLGITEGLFVFTPHAAGAKYFAVVAFGETSITSGDNITDDPVQYAYDPIGDPVEAHLQALFPSPFSPIDHFCFAYYMWVDGRDDHLDRRPDFPVMANAAKNGMAGFFMISVPNDLDTTQSFPLSVWLHGGGGTARQSLAGSRAEVNIKPRKGILLAHNDDVFGIRGTTPAFIENPSLHFGWRENWDPFTSDNLPPEPDTIVNYSQRKYLWIDEWLIRKFNVDRTQIHIHGHSMGSWGATGLAKAFPQHYASVVLFNNGFRAHEEDTPIAAMFGNASQHFPTNLKNRAGGVVNYPEPFDLNTNVSAQRDIPFFQSFHSKNDTGNANYWGVEVVENYRQADSMGHGMALYWSERAHGMDTGPDFNDHWINGSTVTTQTAVDNVAWHEEYYRSDVSYPAFFNHRLDPNANDPGDGTPGTGASAVGDDWGTWGGWHRWDTESIVDEPDSWSGEVWLESDAFFPNDESPFDQLTSDMSIRRPQQFKPVTGQIIFWYAQDILTGDIVQEGLTNVYTDNLVTIEDLIVYKENIRRLRVTMSTIPIAVEENELFKNKIQVFPNPFTDEITITVSNALPGYAHVKIITLEGKVMDSQRRKIEAGTNQFIFQGNNIPKGSYYVSVECAEGSSKKLVVKL